MFTKSIVLSCLGLFAANASAQCATLTVIGTGAPGTNLQFHLDAQASDAFAFVAASFTQGPTTISFGPFGSLTLGLGSFVLLPLGLTNSSGNASTSLGVPSWFPLQIDLFTQGGTAEFSFIPFGLQFCTSNVTTFHFGV
jgi:hypothetical protein